MVETLYHSLFSYGLNKTTIVLLQGWLLHLLTSQTPGGEKHTMYAIPQEQNNLRRVDMPLKSIMFKVIISI